MAVFEPHIPKGKNMNKRFDGWIHVLCDRIQHIDILRHSGSGWGSRSDPKVSPSWSWTQTQQPAAAHTWQPSEYWTLDLD